MLLEVRNLVIDYRATRGRVRAVDGVSFDVPAGAVVGVVGESGCGKTTAVRAITRIMPSSAVFAAGSISLDGKDLVQISDREMRKHLWRDIAYIPQSAMNALDPVWRVGKQVEEVLVDRGGMNRKAARTRSEELFAMVGLEAKRLRDYPHQFSGGMRQRASIALALALSPKLVIADEPVTALDVVIQRQVLDTFVDLQKQLNLSVILVTHDISVVAYVCDYVVVMYAGKVVESGPVADVLDSPGHPYTMGLYNAFPELGSDDRELSPIEGSPPDLMDPPKGCRFRLRCPFAIGDCMQDPPEHFVGEGHVAYCHRASEAHQLRHKAKRTETWVGVTTE